MTVYTGNEWEFETEFRPFNDLQDARAIAQAVIKFNATKAGIDTSSTNGLRQGVEIRDFNQLYGSTQPKIWAGNINHFTKASTVGQARSWVEFTNSTIFKELPRFDPVAFLVSGDDYSAPLYFNEGPQSEEEAIIEPFTIPYRKDHNGPYFPRQVHAGLEDGNNFEFIDKRASRLEQFIYYDAPEEVRYFLDEGSEEFGGIIIDGYTPQLETQLQPFDETRDEEITKQTTSFASGDDVYISVLNRLNYDLSDDIRGTFGRKSATAGNVIDASYARYGTDSITFIGRSRG